MLPPFLGGVSIGEDKQPRVIEMGTELSIVIPAYNEAKRLPAYLESIRLHFTAVPVDGYEAIVVDDGSSDGTAELIRKLEHGWPELRLIEHATNYGKGAAVRTGMLAAIGDMVVFTDADGATPIGEEQKLRAALSTGADVAIGSRHGGKDNTDGLKAARPWHRGCAGRVFATLARNYLGLDIADTQCGFKMFRREQVAELFGPCQEVGYIFDLYILGAAVRAGCRVDEIPITWREIPGSKVHLIRDSWRMLSGLKRVRRSLRRLLPKAAVGFP